MKRLGVLFLLLLLVAPVCAEELSALYTHFKLHIEGKIYSVIYIEPHDMRAEVNRFEPAQRTAREKALVWHYWNNHHQAQVLLGLAANHVEKFYLESGVIGADSSPAFVSGIRKSIIAGQMPLLMISDVNNPYKLHVTRGKGLDLGKGVPTEVRCLGREVVGTQMRPVPRAKIEVKRVPILALNAGDSLDIDED
ncbi:MAG: hypothetical protein KDD39_09535, partial [Bdellovibrionales bacterium]|nr:hypothetical protein [Bdellovibrionales bacterium]